MSLVLNTGAMKYRENSSDPWKPLVIKANMNWESMAETYDPVAGVYEEGELVLEDGRMYRCTVTGGITTPEAWDPQHWTETSVADELGGLKTSLNNLLIAEFDSTDGSIVFRDSEVASYDSTDGSIIINV